VSIYPTTLIERTIREKIVIVGVLFPGEDAVQLDRDLDELARLVDTAGAEVVARITQRREAPDAATFLGSGKVEELKQVCLQFDSDTVVFDHILSPAQQRNLEKILGRTAIDRTAVILDIFAQNARSPEGRAQVELALLQYRLPRLRRSGASLAQQSGGIGTMTRGSGETQLEMDRRRLVQRMHALERELKRVTKTRTVQRQSRERGRQRLVTLVGYTNAGKSSLLNALTLADVPAEDRLFVTLDPRTRQLPLPGGETILVTDTVGFISKLPHELVDAFKSTLDSVKLSDLLLHVVDASSPVAEEQIETVREVLKEIGAGDVPELLMLNKCDLDADAADQLAQRHPGSVVISAGTGEHLEDAVEALSTHLRRRDRVVTLRFPVARGDLIAAAHREGEVLEAETQDETYVMKVMLDEVGSARFAEWVS
jgi:GTP-binding protein HflX